MKTAAELRAARCAHATEALKDEQLVELLAAVPDWSLHDGKLVRSLRFADYFQTLAFVNAVAALAQQQDHHPEMSFGYNRCRIAYDTHSVGGLSINDFICAARIDAMHAALALAQS